MRRCGFQKDCFLPFYRAKHGVVWKFVVELNAPFPARSCIQVAALPRDALVEIEAVAAINSAAE